jgi:hypothetical protein
MLEVILQIKMTIKVQKKYLAGSEPKRLTNFKIKSKVRINYMFYEYIRNRR